MKEKNKEISSNQIDLELVCFLVISKTWKR